MRSDIEAGKAVSIFPLSSKLSSKLSKLDTVGRGSISRENCHRCCAGCVQNFTEQQLKLLSKILSLSARIRARQWICRTEKHRGTPSKPSYTDKLICFSFMHKQRLICCRLGYSLINIVASILICVFEICKELEPWHYLVANLGIT